MSISSARVICTGCDYETREFYRPILIRYKLENGNVIESRRATGWCFDCRGYSDIENLNQGKLHTALAFEEHERLQTRQRLHAINRAFLATLRHRAERKQLMFELRQQDEELSHISGMLKLAMSRKSKAKCLKCGSNKTHSISFDSTDNVARNFVHECGGNLQIMRDSSGPRIRFRVTTLVLNEQGERLSSE